MILACASDGHHNGLMARHSEELLAFLLEASFARACNGTKVGLLGLLLDGASRWDT